MKNVYDLVAEFYQGKDKYEQVVAQDAVEKYLRKKAWNGADEAHLRFLWDILATVMTYIEEQDLYGLFSLDTYDHIEILYRLADKDKSFTLDEADVRRYFDAMRDIADYIATHFDDKEPPYSDVLDEAQKAFYLRDMFLMPPRHALDEFYSSLDRGEGVEEEDIVRLNDMLDALLRRVGEYFQKEPYKRDFNRALTLYMGPEGGDDDPSNPLSMKHPDFWPGFWDFFLFDYHLIESDETPLYIYFMEEREKLSVSEQDIVRDLLHSEFRIFYVSGVTEDGLSGRDLFTDELIELPPSEWGMMDLEHMIFFGHMHMRGIMMLNYVTAIPASEKLRARMKDILLGELEIYRCQDSEARLSDFFGRESAAVRHILHIMSSFAQLNLLKQQNLPERLVLPVEVADHFKKARADIIIFAMKLGFSRFAAKLLTYLFDDYLCVAEVETSPHEISAIVTACIISFGNLNGLCFDDVPNIESMLGAPASRVAHHMRGIHERLDCLMFDPRYLIEEGFVFSLYYH